MGEDREAPCPDVTPVAFQAATMARDRQGEAGSCRGRPEDLSRSPRSAGGHGVLPQLVPCCRGSQTQGEGGDVGAAPAPEAREKGAPGKMQDGHRAGPPGKAGFEVAPFPGAP